MPKLSRIWRRGKCIVYWLFKLLGIRSIRSMRISVVCIGSLSSYNETAVESTAERTENVQATTDESKPKSEQTAHHYESVSSVASPQKNQEAECIDLTFPSPPRQPDKKRSYSSSYKGVTYDKRDKRYRM
jgi:hypothetical protein